MSDYDHVEFGLCWGTLQHAGVAELIEAAGRHGFPTLSIRPDATLNYITDGPGEADLRQRLKDAGVRIRVIDALGAGLPGMPEAGTHILGKQAFPPTEENCFRAAEAAESPFINVALYGGERVEHARLVEAIGGIAERAGKRGIGLVLEFTPDSSIYNVEAARNIVRDVDLPNCRVLLDPWHLSRSGGKVADVEALPPGTLAGFQLCDRIPTPPGTPYVPMTGRSLPGEGELPLHDIFRAAMANNPAMTVELEVFSAELRDMTVDAATKRTRDALDRWRAQL